MDWQLVHQEYVALPTYGRVLVWRDVTEFVTRRELRPQELIDLAKQTADKYGLVLLSASLWSPEGEEASRRWLSDVRVTFDPAIYPYRITAGHLPDIAAGIIEDLGIVEVRGIEKIIGEEMAELLRILPELIMMIMMMMMMGMFMR